MWEVGSPRHSSKALAWHMGCGRVPVCASPGGILVLPLTALSLPSLLLGLKVLLLETAPGDTHVNTWYTWGAAFHVYCWPFPILC